MLILIAEREAVGLPVMVAAGAARMHMEEILSQMAELAEPHVVVVAWQVQVVLAEAEELIGVIIPEAVVAVVMAVVVVERTTAMVAEAVPTMEVQAKLIPQALNPEMEV